MQPTPLAPDETVCKTISATSRFVQNPPRVSAIAGNDRSTSAIVYCEGNVGAIDGKTANGLVRYSERYEVPLVVDSEKAGLDAGLVLDGKPDNVTSNAGRLAVGT